MFELAGATFAFEVLRIPQAKKQRRLPIDGCPPLLTDVPGRLRKKATGKDLSLMGDEDEPLAVIQATRGAPDRVGHFVLRLFRSTRLPLGNPLL